MRIDLHVADLGQQPPAGPDDDRWLPVGDLDSNEKVGTALVRAYLGKAKMPRGNSLYFFADVDPASPGRDLLDRCYPEGDIRSLGARAGEPFWLLFTPADFGGRAFRTSQPARFGQSNLRAHEPHPGLTVQPLVVGIKLTHGGDGFLTEV